jgi:hypothetical protein
VRRLGPFILGLFAVLVVPEAARAQDAASLSISATHGEFELRDVLEVSSARLNTTQTLVTTKYRTLCRTPCRLAMPPGPVNLWAVEVHEASPEVRQKLWLGSGNHDLTIKAGNTRAYTVGLLGVLVGGLTGGLALYKYLRPGTTEQFDANGQLTEMQNPGSPVALGLAIGGLSAFAIGGIVAIVADTRISGAETPTSTSAD